MPESTQALRLPPDIGADVAALAKAADRPQDWIVQRALQHYLAGEGGDILAAAKGRAEFDAGMREDFDGVLADIEVILHGKAA